MAVRKGLTQRRNGEFWKSVLYGNKAAKGDPEKEIRRKVSRRDAKAQKFNLGRNSGSEGRTQKEIREKGNFEEGCCFV